MITPPSYINFTDNTGAVKKTDDCELSSLSSNGKPRIHKNHNFEEGSDYFKSTSLDFKYKVSARISNSTDTKRTIGHSSATGHTIKKTVTRTTTRTPSIASINELSPVTSINQHGDLEEEGERQSSIEVLHQQDGMTYPDGGLKAWSVVLGVLLGLVCCFGLLNTTGAIESYISKNILVDVSSTSISWIFSIFSFITFGGNLVSGILFDLMGARKLCLIGAAMIVGGLFATANSTKLYQFILGFGICSGTGCALMMAPLVSVVSHYFKRNRGLALGIAMPGASIGGVVWPLVCRSLYPEIGYVWTIRTLGFIFLGTLVTSCVLVDDRLNEIKEFEKLKNGGVDPNEGKSMWSRIMQGIDFGVLKDNIFMWLVLSLFLNEFSLVLVTTYVPSYALNKGYTESIALVALTVLNASGIMGRYLPSHLSDHYGNFNLMILCSLLMTLSIFVFWLPFGNKEGTFFVFCILYGFGMAGTLALTPLCTSAISKPQDIGKRYGTAYFFVSFGNLFCLPIGMQITKTSAGYNGMVAFCGATCAVSTITLVITRYRLAGFKKISV
ncbi:unnamed protein product [Ambrosiozyma monospora]|uniref:Unnamed protein product n=1 Tax=Ambrosiozyma monospora TaxID=43982 RepID=A0ACB5T7L9_AMBMO|nr:unnamed protein product [Ambrosiozyma monospora]